MRCLLSRSLVVLCGLSLLACASAQRKKAVSMPTEGWSIRSPGGQITVEVRSFIPQGVAEYPSQPRLYYRAFVGGGDARFEMLRWSPLGITRADADFTDDLRFIGDKQSQVTETYTMARGKRIEVSKTGVEQVLSFETPQQARLDLVVRVFDDGFGLCYRFPEGEGERVSITREITGFRMAEGLRATLLPAFEPGTGVASAEWMMDLAVGTPAPTGASWALPALFSSADGSRWALLAESGVAPGHAIMGLAAKSDGGLYRLRFPHPDEESGRGAIHSSGALPWSTPWRVIIMSDHLATLVESTLLTDLAPAASAVEVQPGNAVWPLAGRDARAGREAVNLAASLNWGYAMLSATWPSMEGGTWSALAKEAAAKKVGLLIGSREAGAVPWPAFAKAGLKGARVSVPTSGKPEVVRSLLTMLEEARKANQVVELEGRIAPAGWDRTYPNLLGSTEWRSGSARNGARQARQNTIEPFTRNIGGPMRPMPLSFKHSSRPAPMTYGHMLGSAVVFESGLTTLVESAAGLPKEATEILAGLPAAWDETRLLEGDPGHTVIIARRAGRTWYVGGLNGDSGKKKREVPMELVGTGLYQMVLVADGPTPTELLVTKRERNATDTQGIKFLPYGGFLMRLSPQR
jgi:alpha-glucosidase